jgi:hypothetical protein
MKKKLCLCRAYFVLVTALQCLKTSNVTPRLGFKPMIFYSGGRRNDDYICMQCGVSQFLYKCTYLFEFFVLL